MTDLPQSHANCRAPRVGIADITPAVLRFQDGRRTPGKLKVISLTGGLLSLSKPLDRGSRVKVMFLTHSGPVLGAAEMLSPVASNLQPFRFVALDEGDQRRLRMAIHSSLNQNPGEQEWIEKYRAALIHRHPPRRRLFGVVLGALTLVALCLGSAMYLFDVHMLK